MRAQQPLNTGGYVFFLKLSSCEQKKLDSASFSLWSREEEGLYYAVDLGGTNFRVLRVCWVENKGTFSSKNSRRLPFLQH